MFKNTSYNELMGEYLSYAPEGIDTRQGSLYYDAGAGFLFLLGRFYSDLDFLYNTISLASAQGKYLDSQGKNYGVERLAATKARYFYTFSGAEPPKGSSFFSDGIFFELEEDEGGKGLFLVAREAGSAANEIAEGTAAIPVEMIPELERMSFGSLERQGTDEESDDKYRERIRGKLSGPAENGNKQHYKTWCESVDGVESARIIVPADESFSVIGVILDKEGRGVGESVLNKIQNYIDPNKNGDGSGVANIGATFTAVSPAAVTIKVTFTGAQWDSDKYSFSQAKELVRTAVTKYFKDINLNAGNTSYFVTAAKIGAEAILSGGINNYDSLTISADGVSSGNTVEISAKHFAALGDFSLS